ncbi:SAMH1-like protein, partial [Mya arenaria]
MDVQNSDGESSHKKARLNEDYAKWDAETLNEELKGKGLGDVAKLFRPGRLVRAIKSRQPDLGITDKDVLCIEIAGLCHDLGHGPFSHLFDREFIPKVLDKKWEIYRTMQINQFPHEQASKLLLDHMLKNVNLKKEFKKYELTEDDITFIKEQIWPEMKDNERNGIDVDKWDYLARDCYMLGIQNNFDHNRCIHFARVLDVKIKSDVVEKQIFTREKEALHLYDMFFTRITDALIEADDCITFT